MHGNIKGLLWTAGITALSGSAIAQQAPARVGANATASIEQSTGEIIVTAQKRAQRLIDVPQSVSVVSADLLQQTHADRFQDFFTRVPSAAFVEGQAGQTRLILRGINTGGVGATVATYVDETPYGSATALANGGILTPDLDPSDIDRIEVLRGPQGTLYGANSLGGLLKFVTTVPSTSTLGGSAEASVETVDHGNTGYSGRAAINLPVADVVGIRASGFYRKDPGFISDPRFGNNINDGETYGGRVSVLLKPTDRFTIRGTAMLDDLNSNGTNAQDVDPVTLKPVYGDRVQQRIIRTPNNTKYRVYNGTADYDLGPVKIVSSTSWGNLDVKGEQDASGAFGPFLSGLLGTPVGSSIDQAVHQRRFTQEVRITASAPTIFDYTLGAFYTHESNDIHQVLNAISLANGSNIIPNLQTVDLTSTYRELAGFANATVHFTHQLDLTFGGRYSGNKQFVNQGGTTGNSSDGVWTYSVAPSYKPSDNVLFYGRVAKGYRPGGPNVLPVLAPGNVPRQFGPDTTTNYEIGVKTDLLDRKLSLEVTGFYIDWNNIQLLGSVGGTGVNINAGSARSKGIEASATARPIKGLSLSANGAYVDAYLRQDAPPESGGLRGQQLPYSARVSFTLAADYERPLSDKLNGLAGVSWRYTGSRFADFTNQTPGLTPVIAGHQHLSPFGQIDAHVGVTFDKFRIDAFARNLTDSKGIVNVSASGSGLSGSIAEAIVRPRSFGATLGFKY